MQIRHTVTATVLFIFNCVVQTSVYSIPYLKKTHLMGKGWFLHMLFLMLYKCAFAMRIHFDQIWYLIALIIITGNDRHFVCPIICTDIYSQCYFVHRHLHQCLIHQADWLIGTASLSIIASNDFGIDYFITK